MNALYLHLAIELLKKSPCQLQYLEEFLQNQIPFESQGHVILSDYEAGQLAKEVMCHTKITIFKGIEMDDWVGHVEHSTVVALRKIDTPTPTHIPLREVTA